MDMHNQLTAQLPFPPPSSGLNAAIKAPRAPFILAAPGHDFVAGVPHQDVSEYFQLCHDADREEELFQAVPLLAPIFSPGESEQRAFLLQHVKTGAFLQGPEDYAPVCGTRPFLADLPAAEFRGSCLWQLCTFVPDPADDSFAEGQVAPPNAFTVVHHASRLVLNVPGGKQFRGQRLWLWDNPGSRHSAWQILRRATTE